MQVTAKHSTNADGAGTVVVEMSHATMCALADLLEAVDLNEYATNPGTMGVDDATGEEWSAAGYALLEALNKL